MKTLSRFITKFTSLIVAVLSCFDRVIFKGHLALAAPCELEYFVDRVLEGPPLRLHEDHGAPVLRSPGRACPGLGAEGRPHLRVSHRPVPQGRVGPGPHPRPRHLRGTRRHPLLPRKPAPPSHSCPAPSDPSSSARPRQQRVLYYYFLDPQFGLIHVRLQTWLPFTVQVYVNGHEWLAQQMVQKKLGFVQQHNAFTQLDDPVQAQRLADRFAKLNWPKILDRWARSGQSVAPRTAPRLPRALGRRSSRVRHRLAVHRVARPWPACTAHCWITRCAPLPPRTSSAFSAASGTAASMARCTPTTKTSAGSAPGSSTA